MMAIELPDWLEPVLNLYGIPWPDIDEDAFHDLRQPLRNFGEDLDGVGDAIASALQLLESGNSSRTLRAITGYFNDIRMDFLTPAKGVCDDLSGGPCDVAYDSIVGVKLTLIGLLAGEIANDVADVVATVVTLGLDSVLTAAEAVAVREAVSESLTIAEGDVASTILSAANQCVDNVASSLVDPFISGVSRSVENAVDSYAPQLILRQSLALEESVAERLHLSPSDLDQCIASISESSQHLVNASQKLDSAIEEIFSHPAATPQVSSLSSALRMVVKGVVSTVEQDLVEALGQLIDHIVMHFVNLLQDYSRAVGDLDQQAREVASREHIRLGPEVVVLSAAGVGAEASFEVARVMGAVNGEEAERVQVERVVALENIEAISISAKGKPLTTEGTAASVTTGEGLQLKVSAASPEVATANADAGTSGVASIDPKQSAAGPHVSSAQGVPGPTTTPGRDHGAEHVRHLTDASDSPQNVSHLDAKHPDGRRPSMGTASNSEHGVEGVRAADAAGSSNTDGSPVEHDVD